MQIQGSLHSKYENEIQDFDGSQIDISAVETSGLTKQEKIMDKIARKQVIEEKLVPKKPTLPPDQRRTKLRSKYRL